MVSSFGYSLLALKEHCKVLKEHGVISVYYNPLDNKLMVQMRDLKDIEYRKDNGDLDTEVVTTTHESDGQTWVRSSRQWFGIELFHVAPLKGGESDV